MKKRLMSLLLILCSVLFIDNCYACPYTYDNYVDLNIEHAYVVGDYVFDLDRGYTPTLEDFARAARTIPKGTDEYVYEIQIIEDFDYYLFTNIFTGESSKDKDELNLDLKYVYRASIKNASPKDYDILNCKTYDIKVAYTALETEGEGEYKTSARRYVSVQSTNGISEAKYCLTTGDTCKPSIAGTVDGNPGVMTIDYETNKDFQRVCVEVKDNDNNTSDTVCDEITVKVDKDAAEVENTNKLETVIEGEPHGLDELFNISYSVSGGIVNYYYYVEEDGFRTKYLLTDLSDLPSGDVEVEVMVRGGNGLVTREKRIIKVKKNVITYDYQTNGGTSASIKTDEVMYNGRANLRATATKEGYEFVGWNTNPNADYPLLELEVKENVTLYAIFRKNIRADFEIYNEAGDIPAVSEFKSSVCTIYNNETSCDVTVPEISAKVGYVAYGWNKTKGATIAELVGNETITINGNTKYYSVTRDKVGLTATFNHYENNKLTRSLKKCYLYNGATTCTVNASGIVNSDYEGRKFVGFTESKDNIKAITGDITISKGHEYYAYYEDVYNINYVSGANTTKVEQARVTFIMDIAGIERKVEEKTIPAADALSGYQTLGWRKDKESTTAEYSAGDKIIVEENTSFYGVYSKDVTLTYTGDAETSNIPARDVKKSYYNSGSKVQSPVRFVLDDATKISKKDSTFLAWKEGNVNHDAGSSITTKDNVTVEATWTFNGCIITLDYQTNGGASADKSSVTYIHGSSDPIDVKTIRAYRPGWLFVGWGTNPSVKENVLSTYKPNNSEVKEVTLYAIFKKNVTVNYRLQDTEAFNLPVAEQYKFTIYNQEAGEDITLPTANKTKLNYEFLGWSTDSKSIEKEYDQGQVVKVNDNTTFYSVTKNTDALTSSYHYYDGTTKKIDKVSCYRYNNSPSCVTKSNISGVKYNNVGVFAGWSTKADSIAESTKQEITKNTNFYAIYDRVLSVTYNSGVNSVTNPTYTYEMNYLTNDTSIKEFGAAIVLDTPDGIDGYTTLGWREDKTANVATVESGSTATINSNKTYYGVYKKSLTLSYAANGGDTIPDSVTKTIYYNSSMADAEVASTYSLANAITRTGYSFTGWMVENDPSKTYQAGANISIKKNTKMYAKWEAKSYVVTYDYLTNGGTSVSVGSKKTTYLTNVDLTPTATRAGYEFVGWSTNPADKEPLEEYKMPFEDITLYAIFKKKVTATWLMVDPLAGSIEKATTSCYKFNNATTCQIETGNVITNAGYTALGFAATSGSKDVIAGNNIFTDIASDKTFYSVTRKTAPLVGTFYYGEGTTSKTMNANCVLYNGATSCTISAPIEPVTYKNVPFVNWSSNKTSYVASNMTISSNKNYYAYYNQILMLTYHDGETDNILTETKELKYIISDTGETATIPTITTKTPTSISGYTTLGWREDDVQGEATQASNQTKQITQSYEYYAVYKRTITLSYNANNGSTTPANQTATQYFNAAAGATNHTFTLAAAIARPGYTFVSWTKGSTTGTEYAAGTSINILEDTIFYAKWVLNNFTLTYNANGGTLTEKSKIVHYGEAYGTLPKPTRTGYDFAGWFTAATGGNEIKAETIVSELKDHTIYAHWNVHKNTLTRTVDNSKFGSVSGPSGSIAYDTSVTLVATPMAGFIFAGWYEGNTMVSYDATYTFKMPDRAVSLIAKFSFDITSITDINVLNVYPDTGNSLKTWMETNGYGKSIIRVTPVSITNFNANPGAYLGSSGKWNYDVVVYGFWDSNGSKDISASAATLTAQYLDENNPVVFGHDTLRATFPNFAKLMPYVNITSKTGSSNYTSNQIIINRTGIFTTYPWSIGNEGTILTIPSTHVSSQYANGDIWLQLGSTAMSDRNNFYLTTYQNAAMIQTGHSSGQATNDEQKILANLIFFLYSQKVMSEL